MGNEMYNEEQLAHAKTQAALAAGCRRAVYWSVRDVEQLSCESPEEALEEWLDDIDEDEATLAARCPVTVTGYARRVVDGAEYYVERMVERLAEDLCEEYGDPDGDNVLSADAEGQLRADITAALQKAFASAVPWQCEPLETRTYSADEVIAAYRALRGGEVTP